MNTLISNRNIELIELDARFHEEALFFQRCGFTGLGFNEKECDPDYDALALGMIFPIFKSFYC